MSVRVLFAYSPISTDPTYPKSITAPHQGREGRGKGWWHVHIGRDA
jgi:hypothetical protein